jgi:hypothetical protein
MFLNQRQLDRLRPINRRRDERRDRRDASDLRGAPAPLSPAISSYPAPDLGWTMIGCNTPRSRRWSPE